MVGSPPCMGMVISRPHNAPGAQSASEVQDPAVMQRFPAAAMYRDGTQNVPAGQSDDVAQARATQMLCWLGAHEHVLSSAVQIMPELHASLEQPHWSGGSSGAALVEHSVASLGWIASHKAISLVM